MSKMSIVLLNILGCQWTTAIELNKDLNAIGLNPDASKICTIKIPWCKYSKKRLPIAESQDIFKSKICITSVLVHIRIYLDNLFVLTKDFFEDRLVKLEVVLEKLLQAGLRVNAKKKSSIWIPLIP